MVSTATLIGAAFGLSCQLYSNAVRKLPLMRHPWEHVLGMGLGVWAGNALVKWEEKASADLEKMLEETAAQNRRRYGGHTPNRVFKRALVLLFGLLSGS